MRSHLVLLFILTVYSGSVFASSQETSLFTTVLHQRYAFFENLTDAEKQEMDKSLTSLKERNRQIRKKQAKVRAEERALEKAREFNNKSKLLSESEQEIYNRGVITSGQRITGGVIGTTLGFGLGHLSMNRYTTTAMVFTITDVMGTAALVGGWISMDPNDNEMAGIALIPGFCILAASRLVQIFHVWIMPLIHNREYHNIKARVARGARPSTKLLFTPMIPSSQGVVPGVGFAVEFF